MRKCQALNRFILAIFIYVRYTQNNNSKLKTRLYFHLFLYINASRLIDMINKRKIKIIQYFKSYRAQPIRRYGSQRKEVMKF